MRATLVVAMACLSTLSALAQTTAIDEARERARLHLGGLYVTPALQLKEMGVDSNVFNEPGSTARDFTINLAPGAQLALPIGRRALVESTLAANLVYFQRYASQRSVNPNASVRVTGFFRRLTLAGGGGYLNTHERMNQEIDARAGRTDKSAHAAFDIRVVPKFSVGLSGVVSHADYAEGLFFRGVNLRESLANDLWNAAMGVKYIATPLTSLGVRGEMESTRFPFSPLKNADSVRVTSGVVFKPRALISGSAFVGIRRFKPLSADVPEFRGLVAAISLRYSVRSATAFALTLDRDVQYSYEQLEPYFVSTAVGASIRRQLFGPFDTTVGTQWFQHRYRDVLTSPVPNDLVRVDVIRNYSGDVGYRFGRKSRVGVGVSYWSRDSNRADFAVYEGFRAATTLTYGF